MNEIAKSEDIKNNMYDDIIELKRPKSEHKKLDISSRSAQFMPFSALETFEDTIENTSFIIDRYC